MKRIYLFFFVIALGLTFSVKAQVIDGVDLYRKALGVTAGVNYQTIYGSPFKPQFNSGFLVGLFGEYKGARKGIKIELTAGSGHFQTAGPVSTPYPKGKKLDYPKFFDTVNTGDFSATYLHLPILLEFKFYKAIFFQIGPEITQQLSIKDNNGAYTQDYPTKSIQNVFKKTELSYNIGFEGKIKGKVNAGIRFSEGITNINNKVYERTYDNFQIWRMQATVSYNLRPNE